MHRIVVLLAALLVVLAACDDDDPPTAETTAEDDEPDDGGAVGGLRVGIVLPPADVAVADEHDRDVLALDDVGAEFGDELGELRAVSPDEGAFTSDVAQLLVDDGYDVVCVIGHGATRVVGELAPRHPATEFCAAPGSLAAERDDNVLVVDVALEELGHVVGTALAQLGGDEPVAVVTGEGRSARDRFRRGLRAGVGATPLLEIRSEGEERQQELEAALAEGVAAVALDLGVDGGDLVELADEVPVLAPMPLVAQPEAAMTWRVRWDEVVRAVLAWRLDPETDPPERLGLSDGAFEVLLGARLGGGMADAVEEVMGELEAGARAPLEAPAEEDADDQDAEPDEQDPEPDDEEDAAAAGSIP